MTKTYKIFSDCLITNGHTRSLICDLGRNKYHLIPNFLAQLLAKGNLINFDTMKLIYNDPEQQSIIEEYFNFLIDNELVFECDEDNETCFPELNLDWDYPFEISNAIIDIDKKSTKDIQSIFLNLNNIYCKHCQIRFFVSVSMEDIREILNTLDKDSFLNSIELVMPFAEDFTKHDAIQQFMIDFPIITAITLYNSRENSFITVKDEFQEYINVVMVKDNIHSCLNCGKVNKSYFNLSISQYTEAQQFNSCLNRKISIDVNGNIKNCPSMKEAFGNIKNTTLEEALNKKGFKKNWNIKKDDIAICKDCEFRYICTDCRAYVEDPKDIYSKPLKCGYSPYTNKWEEWSTNPLKQKAIEFYGLSDTKFH